MFFRNWAPPVLLIALLCATAASASEPPAPVTALHRQVWTTRDGLPHNSINAIAQTADGHLWIASWEGLVRFNGRRFDTFGMGSATGLPHSGVHALRAQNSGGLLAGGSLGGISRLIDGSWVPLEAVPSTVVSLLTDRKGRIWVGTSDSGILRIHTNGLRRFLLNSTRHSGLRVHDQLEDREGRIWVATSQGLFHFDQAESNAAVEVPEFTGLPVFGLAQSLDGRLLVGTEQGLWHGVPAGLTVAFSRDSSPLGHSAITRLLEDSRGHLWAGTMNDGVFRLSERGVENLGVDNGMPASRVLSLTEDREGNIWVGTNGGLVRLTVSAFTNVTRAEGLTDNFVRAVLAHSDGSLWVGTSAGLHRHTATGTTPVDSTSALRGRSVLSLAEGPNRTVWIGTSAGGVFQADQDRVRQRFTRDHGLPSNEVRAMLQARDGSLWIGTRHGLVRRSATGSGSFDTIDGLPSQLILSLMESEQGEIWVGTGAGAAIVLPDAQHATAIGLPAPTAIFNILEQPEHDSVWLATHDGLIRIRRSDQHVSVLGTRSGLPFETFFHVAAGPHGYFWLTGNHGVIRLAQADAHAIADGSATDLAFDHYTDADGLASSQANGGSQPSAAIAPDGTLWFATAQGLAGINPATIPHIQAPPPPVVIDGLAADGAPLSVSPLTQLPAGVKRVSIQFAGLHFVMPGRLRYRYQLLGFDADWVECGPVDSVEYTNLAPGEYTFLVSAALPKGEWSDPHSASLAFHVAPHLWQRSSVWLGLLAVLIVATAAWARIRHERTRRREQRLKALVDARTEDLRLKTERLQVVSIERAALLEQMRTQSALFERQAREDALTGLMNRRSFDEAFERELARLCRSPSPMSLALIDADHFKRINDSHSHNVGDAVLKSIASLMLQEFREVDVIARWGGEEFVVLFPGTGIDAATLACERLRQRIQANDWNDHADGLGVTVSIGIASATELESAHALLSRADAALYAAKHSGRNRVCQWLDGAMRTYSTNSNEQAWRASSG